MLKHLSALAILVATGLCAPAFAVPVSTESVEKLLALTQVEKLLVSVRAQTDQMVTTTTTRMLDGRQASPEERKRMADFQARAIAGMREEMSWEKLKPLYVQIYVETFSQEEIDGLIAFYESPAGQAYIAKMPMVAQKSMAIMQERMAPMLRRLQENVGEFMKEPTR
jgi:uncharacterized protein